MHFVPTRNPERAAMTENDVINTTFSVPAIQRLPRLRRILTYGTFDLLHYGHIRLLRRAAALGDYLIVALSTDEFGISKGKAAFYPYSVRREMLEAVRYVDLVIPEVNWEQKRGDVQKYQIDAVVMGSDWEHDERFTSLVDICEVIFLDRTTGISSTDVKIQLSKTSPFIL